MRYRRKRLRVLARRVSVLSLRRTVSILSRIVRASLLLPLPPWEIFPRTCRSPRTAGPRSPLVNNYQMKIPPPRVGWYLLFPASSGDFATVPMRLFCMATTTTFCPFANKSNTTLLSRIRIQLHRAATVEIGPQYHTNLDSYYWSSTFSIHSLLRPTYINDSNVSMLQLRLSRFPLWNLVVHIWMMLFRNSIELCIMMKIK